MSTPVLDTAVSWWRAAGYSGSGDLLDGTGNSRDMTITGPEFYEPDNWVSYASPGTQYLYYRNVSGNYLATPATAALNITGDLDCYVKVAPAVWSGAGDSYNLGGQWDSKWMFRLDADGKLSFWWKESDGTLRWKASSVATGITDGDPQWVRVTLDLDDDAGDCAVKFYLGGDGDTPSWSQLGTTQSLGATTSLKDTTADPFEIGSHTEGTDDRLKGKLYRAVLKDGIDGTIVFDADLTDRDAVTADSATFTEASAQAATVTLTRPAGTDRKNQIVDQPRFEFAANDYMETADNAVFDFNLATDSFTVLSLWRSYDWDAGTAILISKRGGFSAAEVGYNQYHTSGPKMEISDGVTEKNDAGAACTDGTLHAITTTVTSANIETFKDGVSAGGTASASLDLTNSQKLVIGAQSNYSNPISQGEFFGAAIFDSVLSTDDMITAANELQGVVAGTLKQAPHGINLNTIPQATVSI